MTAIQRTDILVALQDRYDHVSAEVVLVEALASSGLPPSAAAYSAEQVAGLCERLPAVGDRVDGVVGRLQALAEDARARQASQPPQPVAAEPARAERPAATGRLAGRPAAAAKSGRKSVSKAAAASDRKAA